MQIMIVEDEANLRESLKTFLSSTHEVVAYSDGNSALDHFKNKAVDLVLTDNKMPGMTGLELIRRIKEISSSTCCLLMTAHASIDQAVEALKLGAEDYLVKPFELEELDHRLKQIEDLQVWRAKEILRAEGPENTTRILGCSENIKNANEFVAKVALVQSPVLILGPSGTGKEVIAKAINAASPRSKYPFIAINCASLSEQLIESELFGHEKGAFTGANAAKPGKFELAKGGTIFLDEIGELSPGIQARLLRVLQEKEFFRVGGVRQIKSDARVIAATHRPLKQMTKEGSFREDLFFRLSVLTFELQPLCNRKSDLPILIPYFWEKLNQECGRKLKLGEDTLACLLQYSYPGNVRELQNILERLVVMGGEVGVVRPNGLPVELRVKSPEPSAVTSIGAAQGMSEAVEELERRMIADALAKTGGNQAKAAEVLKINRGSMHYKLKKYGFKEAEVKDDEAA